MDNTDDLNISQIVVSIIVPIYCTKRKYLDCCVESLVHQTYPNVEVILVDDGSPDDCGLLCELYAKEYDCVHVIHQENQGVSVARNNGILMSKGKYIMFVDPDDWLELDCVDTVVYEIEKQNADLLLFDYYIDKTSDIRYTEQKYHEEFKSTDLDKIQQDIIAGTDIYGAALKAPWAKIIRKSKIIENNILFPKGIKRAQDAVFNLYLLEYVKSIYELDYIGYHHRIHNDSISYRYNTEASLMMIQLLNEYVNFVQLFHNNDRDYKVCLGIKVITGMQYIERTYTFYPNNHLTRSEILKITDQYINNEVVQNCLKFCTTKDFAGLKNKIKYILMKGKHYNIYYVYKNWKKNLKSLKNN